MKVEQLYTNCLAEAAYYIESEGEAVIIDPLRETDPYLELAASKGTKIKYILETHFHADFVSGHVDLAKKTGATIVYGPTANPDFTCHVAQDGEVLKIGKISLTVLHTPGHTMESTTYLLKDENGKDYAIFTGDTLFIGDVGRPDLAVKSDLTEKDLAGMLYDSLRKKIMTLSDDVIVYPGHGAGSACGKNISKETWSTLGEQKKSNYALQNISREEFITELTTGILPAPQYFAKNAAMNKGGYDSFDAVLNRGNVALTVDDVAQKLADGALILDLRKKEEFAKAHLPGSIFIGLDGQFAVWVGALIKDLNQTIVLIVEEGREKEAVTRLARVGYDHCAGYLKGGIDAWIAAGKATSSIKQITAEELSKNSQPKIIDARKPGEFSAEHAEGALSFPLDYINEHLHDLDTTTTQYLHCKSGYRSMIALSILQANGYTNIIDVIGGFDAMLKTDIAKTNYVCPSTLK
jgi:glyoxylase-like metal-dependent hydrolase (beta-lactamase superfamily II)/rhodanese-related sulfurtransferase